MVEQVSAAAMATDVRPQDNRGFTDTNTAQKLTEGDILQMKNDGKGGRAIIQVLHPHSGTVPLFRYCTLIRVLYPHSGTVPSFRYRSLIQVLYPHSGTCTVMQVLYPHSDAVPLVQVLYLLVQYFGSTSAS